MARKAIPKKTEDEVLALSRRRCCVCFGLHRDFEVKQGQVAHLDRKSSNNDLDNLAFLCLLHHDQYDGRTRQSKGLTILELRRFRRELHDQVDTLWKQPIPFTGTTPRDPSDVSGHYIWETRSASAELTVAVIGPHRIRVTGIALWGTQNQYGPNLGTLDFEAPLRDRRATYVDKTGAREYKIELAFDGDELTATESYAIGYFGLNVTFEGEYRRVPDAV